MATRGDGLVGFADLRAVEVASPVPAVSGAELVRLHVQPHMQRAGVGRSLLTQAERLASSRGLRSLWLTAWDGNAGALVFYRRMGYADRGETSHCFGGNSVGNRVLAKPLPTG